MTGLSLIYADNIVKHPFRSAQEGEISWECFTSRGPFVPFACNHTREFPVFIYFSLEGVEWFGDKKALKIHQCCQGRNIKQQFEDLEGTMWTIKLMEQLLLTEGQGFQGFGKPL